MAGAYALGFEIDGPLTPRRRASPRGPIRARISKTLPSPVRWMREVAEAGRAAQAVSLALAAAVFAPLAPAYAQDTPVVLEGATEDVREAVRATLPDRERPATLFDAERLAEEAAESALAWLRAEGYYSGRAEPIAEDEPPRARVRLELGARFTFADPAVEFDGPPPDPGADAALRRALAPVRAGAPARAQDVIGAEAAAVQALQEAGYADAKAGQRRVVVDHATGLMAATFKIAAGGGVKLGALRVDPPDVLDRDYVLKLADWAPGEQYTPQKLNDLRKDLSSTGAFSRVVVQMDQEGERAGARDVVVRLEEAKKHAVELGGSYSTTEGAGVDAEWKRRNVYGRADTLTLASTLAEREQSVSAELFRPHAAGRNRGHRFGVEIAREDTDPYVRSGVTVTAAVEVQRSVRRAATYGVSVAADVYDESEGVENALIFSGFLDGRFDSSDDRLDPHTGGVLEARVEPSISTGDATTAFVRSTGQARGFWSPGARDRVTLAGRLELGWVAPVSGAVDDLPLDRRFYSGGGGSVRGYEYQSLYPNQGGSGADDPPGGQGLVETSAEARLRLGVAWGGALFVDGGSAFNDWGEASALAWGVGAGVRYDLGFAPIRFDVAVPLDPRPGDPEVSFYVSLGQAF